MQIIFVRADDTIAISTPEKAVLGFLTGTGGWIVADTTEGKTEEESLQIAIDAEIAEQVAAGKPEAATRTFVTALARGGLTELEAVTAIGERAMPNVENAVSMHVMETNMTMDENKYFRSAWRFVDGKVQTDMAAARIIHMNQVRSVRNSDLTALDVPFMRAMESGDTSAQDALKVQKQTLRDIPANFDVSGYATPDLLMKAWPSGLSTQTFI
jgi:hypothetical protein